VILQNSIFIRVIIIQLIVSSNLRWVTKQFNADLYVKCCGCYSFVVVVN